MVLRIFCLASFSWNNRLREAVVSDRFCFEHFFYSVLVFILYVPIIACQQDFYAFSYVPVENCTRNSLRTDHSRADGSLSELRIDIIASPLPADPAPLGLTRVCAQSIARFIKISSIFRNNRLVCLYFVFDEVGDRRFKAPFGRFASLEPFKEFFRCQPLVSGEVISVIFRGLIGVIYVNRPDIG